MTQQRSDVGVKAVWLVDCAATTGQWQLARSDNHEQALQAPSRSDRDKAAEGFQVEKSAKGEAPSVVKSELARRPWSASSISGELLATTLPAR